MSLKRFLVCYLLWPVTFFSLFSLLSIPQNPIMSIPQAAAWKWILTEVWRSWFWQSTCSLAYITELLVERTTFKVFLEYDYHTRRRPDTNPRWSCHVWLHSKSSSSSSFCQHAEKWPTFKFHVSSFSFDVEFRVQKENEAYAKNKVMLCMSWEIEMGILDKLPEALYSFKTYAKDSEFESLAAALVHKHPCL